MLRHVVLMRCPEGVYAQELQGVGACVRELKKDLVGVMGFYFGENSFKNEYDQNFTHGFTLDFVDHDAFENYLKHPLYLDLQQKLRHNTSERSDLLMFTYRTA